MTAELTHFDRFGVRTHNDHVSEVIGHCIGGVARLAHGSHCTIFGHTPVRLRSVISESKANTELKREATGRMDGLAGRGANGHESVTFHRTSACPCFKLRTTKSVNFLSFRRK